MSVTIKVPKTYITDGPTWMSKTNPLTDLIYPNDPNSPTIGAFITQLYMQFGVMVGESNAINNEYFQYEITKQFQEATQITTVQLLTGLSPMIIVSGFKMFFEIPNANLDNLVPVELQNDTNDLTWRNYPASNQIWQTYGDNSYLANHPHGDVLDGHITLQFAQWMEANVISEKTYNS